MVQFLAFGGALLLGRLAGAHRRQADRPRLSLVAVDRSCSCVAYFLPDGRAPCRSTLLGGGDRARARRQPGAVPVAVQPADPGRARRPSTSASTRSATRAPAGWARSLFGLAFQLTGSYRVAIVCAGGLLRASAASAGRWPMRRAIVAAGNTPPERRGRRAATPPVLRPSRPPVTAAGTRRGAPAPSSTGRWTAASPRWPCRSTTTKPGRAGAGCC